MNLIIINSYNYNILPNYFQNNHKYLINLNKFKKNYKQYDNSYIFHIFYDTILKYST